MGSSWIDWSIGHGACGSVLGRQGDLAVIDGPLSRLAPATSQAPPRHGSPGSVVVAPIRSRRPNSMADGMPVFSSQTIAEPDRRQARRRLRLAHGEARERSPRALRCRSWRPNAAASAGRQGCPELQFGAPRSGCLDGRARRRTLATGSTVTFEGPLSLPPKSSELSRIAPLNAVGRCGVR